MIAAPPGRSRCRRRPMRAAPDGHRSRWTRSACRRPSGSPRQIEPVGLARARLGNGPRDYDGGRVGSSDNSHPAAACGSSGEHCGRDCGDAGGGRACPRSRGASGFHHEVCYLALVSGVTAPATRRAALGELLHIDGAGAQTPSPAHGTGRTENKPASWTGGNRSFEPACCRARRE